ncbi:MAG TPA: hypothetical protein VF814_02745 [Casimicrobiaceae bacterium]
MRYADQRVGPPRLLRQIERQIPEQRDLDLRMIGGERIERPGLAPT